jgi:hypothetical protein
MNATNFTNWEDIEHATLIAMQNMPMVKGLEVFRKDQYGNDWQGRITRVQKRHNKQDVSFLQFRITIIFEQGVLEQLTELYEFIPGYIGSIMSEATERKIKKVMECPQCGTECAELKVKVFHYKEDEDWKLVRCKSCKVKGYDTQPVFVTRSSLSPHGANNA